MAMEQYAQETMPQNIFIKDNEGSLDNLKPSFVAEVENSPSEGFDCNICLDAVQDPVVTLCGHLYCWPCIYKWIHHQKNSSEIPNKHNPQCYCPVCKKEISQKTLVPLYGRGQTTKPRSDEKSQDLDMAIPRRPLSPTCGVQPIPTQQLNHLSYQQQALQPASMSGLPISPTATMFGEMVSGGIFGSTQAALRTYPNSYNLAAVSTQRARRQAMQADKSLGRVYFFLVCCTMLCLVLF